MTNEITQKFIDILGPITDDRHHFSRYSQKPNVGGYDVFEMSKVQRELVEQLIIDHYKVRKVLWMGIPSGLTEDGEQAIVAQTHRLTNEVPQDYEGKTAYVYMLLFTPKMHDPANFVKEPVKDGCTFGPVIYNPDNFEPQRTITITFNPTFPQDLTSEIDETELMKQQLRDKLEKVLANPDEYMPEGYRGCLIRMAVN